MIRHIYPIFYLTCIVVDKGSKNAIPERENTTVITVGPRHLVMMVKFMHVRGYKEYAYTFVQPFWKGDVSVREIGE